MSNIAIFIVSMFVALVVPPFLLIAYIVAVKLNHPNRKIIGGLGVFVGIPLFLNAMVYLVAIYLSSSFAVPAG